MFRNDLRVGYLKQLPELDPNLSVIEACLSIDDEPTAAIRTYERALASGDADALAKAMSQMDAAGAWDYEDRIRQTLTQLKIIDMNQPVGQLSGGQVKRVALAKVVINEPELLILDEPTNHLDIDMIEWLESYLQRSRMSLLMVTHDRYFLDKVCSKIVEIDSRQVYAYNGNYDYYLEKREERLSAQSAELAKVKNLLRTELDWMRRQPQARGSKAKYRIDAFHDLTRRSQVRRDDADVQLNVKSTYIGSKIFDAVDVTKAYGDKVILNGFEYTFARYEKVGIVGNNGVGKSTFIKMLLGEVAPDSGHFDIGETVKFGYYSQDGIQFNEQDKVIDAVRRIAEVVVIDEKNALHRIAVSATVSVQPRNPAELHLQAQRRRKAEAVSCHRAHAHPQLPHPRRADQRPRHHDSRHFGRLHHKVPRLRDNREPRPLLPRPHRRPFVCV